MDVLFNNAAGKYQLKLPEYIFRDLNLTTEDGKPLDIFHENKFSVEWLYKDIEQRYAEWQEFIRHSTERRKRKLIISGIVFFIGLLAFILNRKIATLTNNPVPVINILCLVVTVISGWTIFQTYLLGSSSAKESLTNNSKTIQLQQLIIEQFGK